MIEEVRPYKFVPQLKSVLWGGEKIIPLKRLVSEQKAVGESWEISGVPGHESVVAEGPDEGMTISELIRKYKGALVGEKVYERFGDTFPLLIKIIDAAKDLSVQVHPDDALAKQRHNSLGKTEMWYIMDAAPNAKIYAGLSTPSTPDDYARLVAEKKIMDVVACHDSHPSDVFFLPAGRIHAIGAGNILAEIQETSDITYRVYDFDRKDSEGRTRQLHTEEARDAIDYRVYPDYKTNYDKNSSGNVELVKCSHFDVHRVTVDGKEPIPVGDDSFMVVMCISGQCDIVTDGYVATHVKGVESVLIPASVKTIEVSGSTVLLTAVV
ncbi:MAG: class I mannose-6-phosphate isomerase [Muribaculum sp.]|nr:class I mannose-6-phosphate isomerase [Muribaculum sp.]